MSRPALKPNLKSEEETMAGGSEVTASPVRGTIAVRVALVGLALQLAGTSGAEAQHAHQVPSSPVGGAAQAALGAAPATAAIGSRVAEPHGGDLKYGAPVRVGRGFARTFVVVADDGSTELGVALSADVMEGLPANGDPSGLVMPDGLSTFGYELPMPRGNPTACQHVMLDWNPGGHEPPGLYDVAHFDFHFYLIDRATRLGIDPARPDFAERAARLPDPSLIPDRYFLPMPDAVPAMGVHWLDAAAPELKGQAFSQTMLFGSWDGEVIFAEPMITKELLMSKPSLTFEIPTASMAPASGPLPESYTVRWDPGSGEYRVSLHLNPPATGNVR
jgi:hypothetical protein